MNNSIFESIFAVFDDKPPFLSILDTFWSIFVQTLSQIGYRPALVVSQVGVVDLVGLLVYDPKEFNDPQKI